MAPEPISRVADPMAGRVIAAQDWRDVSFVHWRADPDAVRQLLPHGVEPDVFDGSTWVGLIAFRLERARVWRLPPVPYVGTFTEVNVRLLTVDSRGRRAVAFRSLEASRLPAVLAARAMFSLPYRWSRTAQRRVGGVVEYASRRHLGVGRLNLRVEPDPASRVDDDLSTFLTARWALVQTRFGRTMRLPNTHEPWLLHPSRLVSLREDLLDGAGLPKLSRRPPDSVLFSPGVSARFGTPVA